MIFDSSYLIQDTFRLQLNDYQLVKNGFPSLS